MVPLSADTSAEIERMQVDAWRAMTPAEKASMVSALTTAAFAMARAGVQHRHPDATPREVFLRLAIVVHGPELAAAAYPDSRAFIMP